VDINYKYDVGDMVEFTLTVYGSPKVYRGVVSERWGSRDSYRNKICIYKVCCLEKGMREFTVSEILIIGKV